MRSFFGRERELKLLKGLLYKKTSSLVVIRGRRRIGKSRLVQEFSKSMNLISFSGMPPTKNITAKKQRIEFIRRMNEQLNIPGVKSDDWGDLFFHLANTINDKQNTIIFFDEITWMGSKDPTFLAKLKIAWDMYFKQHNKLVVILCGSVSHWIEENIINSTGFYGRISLDIKLDELSLIECNNFWGNQGKYISAYEKFKILSVTGGVPRYLEEIVPQLTAEENLEKLCFIKEGLLFNEFEKIFTDLFLKRSEFYKKIIIVLANKKGTLEDIYKALKIKKNGNVSKYLKDLIVSGFIVKDYSWDLKSSKKTKFIYFRLKDNYLRYYLKYIEPNKDKIHKNLMKKLLGYESIMGLQFENLVLNNRKKILNLLNISLDEIINENPYFQRKNLIQEGCQIDYLIQTRFSNLFLCEIKFCKVKIGKEIISEIESKMKKINIPKNLSIRPVLIHVNGVSDEVEEANYFYKIIDFSNLLSASNE